MASGGVGVLSAALSTAASQSSPSDVVDLIALLAAICSPRHEELLALAVPLLSSGRV